MTRFASIALTSLCLVGLPGAALAQSCSAGRALCEAICTPARAATYYAGSLARCTASCEPRWQQCLRDGVWVHLEDRYPGWREPVARW